MRRVMAVAGLLLLVGACSAPTSPNVPGTLVLRPGIPVSSPAFAVNFVRVVSDSRCPINAQCIQAGDVVATIKLAVPGVAVGEFDLQLNDPTKRAGTAGGFVVELKAVDPFPVAGQPTRPEDYRATVEIRRG